VKLKLAGWTEDAPNAGSGIDHKATERLGRTAGACTGVMPGKTARTLRPRPSRPASTLMEALCDLAMLATSDRPIPLPRTDVPAAR